VRLESDLGDDNCRRFVNCCGCKQRNKSSNHLITQHSLSHATPEGRDNKLTKGQLAYVQSVPHGKVNILEGPSVDNHKQKCMFVHLSYCEWFPR
jgi:hypothetical protein